MKNVLLFGLLAFSLALAGCSCGGTFYNIVRIEGDTFYAGTSTGLTAANRPTELDRTHYFVRQ